MSGQISMMLEIGWFETLNFVDSFVSRLRLEAVSSFIS